MKWLCHHIALHPNKLSCVTWLYLWLKTLGTYVIISHKQFELCAALDCLKFCPNPRCVKERFGRPVRAVAPGIFSRLSRPQSSLCSRSGLPLSGTTRRCVSCRLSHCSLCVSALPSHPAQTRNKGKRHKMRYRKYTFLIIKRIYVGIIVEIENLDRSRGLEYV